MRTGSMLRLILLVFKLVMTRSMKRMKKSWRMSMASSIRSKGCAIPTTV